MDTLDVAVAQVSRMDPNALDTLVGVCRRPRHRVQNIPPKVLARRPGIAIGLTGPIGCGLSSSPMRVPAGPAHALKPGIADLFGTANFAVPTPRQSDLLRSEDQER